MAFGEVFGLVWFKGDLRKFVDFGGLVTSGFGEGDEVVDEEFLVGWGREIEREFERLAEFELGGDGKVFNFDFGVGVVTDERQSLGMALFDEGS